MTNLRELDLPELEDLAAKLRHAIARSPEETQAQRVELENVKQWIALRHQQTENRDSLGSDR